MLSLSLTYSILFSGRNASFANKSLCHSFTRRLSTRIYGWGSNDAGELGKKWKLGDQPTPLCLENDGEVGLLHDTFLDISLSDFYLTVFHTA